MSILRAAVCLASPVFVCVCVCVCVRARACVRLQGKETDSLEEHFNNVFAAVRKVLWPCSAYIAQ